MSEKVEKYGLHVVLLLRKVLFIVLIKAILWKLYKFIIRLMEIFMQNTKL